jgi:hypothetical protein
MPRLMLRSTPMLIMEPDIIILLIMELDIILFIMEPDIIPLIMEPDIILPIMDIILPIKERLLIMQYLESEMTNIASIM